MVFATSQMIQYHKFHEILETLLVKCNDEKVEQVKSCKLLGMEFELKLD